MPKTKSLYSVHPSVRMVQDWITSLPEKTGRSLPQWITLVKKSGLKTENERCDWLLEYNDDEHVYYQFDDRSMTTIERKAAR